MSVYHIVTINWWETNISVGLPAVVTGVTASGPAMSLSTATCEVLKVCGPLLEQHRDQIGLTFYRWPHIYQYLFISISNSYLFISIMSPGNCSPPTQS